MKPPSVAVLIETDLGTLLDRPMRGQVFPCDD